jgi:hypothetical protein
MSNIWSSFDFGKQVADELGAKFKERGHEATMTGVTQSVEWTVKLAPGSYERQHGGQPLFRVNLESPSYRLDTKRVMKAMVAAMKAGQPVPPPAMVSVICNGPQLNPLARKRDGDQWSIEDPRAIFTGDLLHMLKEWPDAWWHGENNPRPALPAHIYCDDDGLYLKGGGWWASAPALHHHIALAVRLVQRLGAEATRTDL